MGNAFGALPAWTNGVLLENLPDRDTQIVDGNLNLRQSDIYTTNVNVDTDLSSQILFTRLGVQGNANFDSNQNVPNFNLLNISVFKNDPRRTFGYFISFCDMVCNKNAWFKGFTYPFIGVITNQLVIQSTYNQPDPNPNPIPNPKNNPIVLTQNTLYGKPINSKILFSYPYDPALPNVIEFNISEFDNPVIFVKDINGVIDLPVTINIANNILTITGIPVVNNECVAFLFLM